MGGWRTLLAGTIVAGLAVALVVVLATDLPHNDASTPTLAQASGSPRTTASTPGDPPSTTGTTTTNVVPSTVVAPTPAIVAMRRALSAWGEYAVSGRVRDLGDHFVAGGPQRRQLRAESEAIRADPPGAPPYVVTAGDVLTVSAAPTDVVMRTGIEWARQGETTQFFVWDIQMKLVDGSWQLFTVVEVEGG